MFNNKGQSLIMFVIFLPILLLILVLVIDIGRIITYKQELDNINKIIIDYGLDNIEKTDLENELINLVKLNNSEVDLVRLDIEEDKIYVDLSMEIFGIFSVLVDKSMFNLESCYVGYMDDENKKIERISR